jgi:16S rRNA (guanine1516-N2)-methyltransferase
MLKIANHTAYHKAAARELVLALDGFELDADLTLTIEDSGIALATDLHGQLTRFEYAFDESRLLQRARQKNQALLRACDNRKGTIKTIVDLTAGWARDSFILAAQGKGVTLIEHHPLVSHCLAYLKAIAQDGDVGSILSRLDLRHGNSLDYLQQASEEQADCLYLDPMFPAHKSQARPGKELQILQLLTDNMDMQSLFEYALKSACQRVVVKRPLHAPPLDDQKPDIVYKEKTIRFDVYLGA